MTTDAKTFTGRSRRRQTRRGVLLADVVARWVISVGGVGTIVAVSLVCVYLLWVAVPLFLPANVEPMADAKITRPANRLRHLSVDEYRLMAAAMMPDGVVNVYRLQDGELLSQHQLSSDQPLTAASFSNDGEHVALGFADGSVRVGRIGFDASFVAESDVPAAIRDKLDSQASPTIAFQKGLLRRTAEGQFRLQRLTIELQPPIAATDAAPIRQIDHIQGTSGATVCDLTDASQLRIRQVRVRKNRLTGKTDQRVTQGLATYALRNGKPPTYLRMFGLGESLLLAWDDGHAVRYDTRDLTKVRVAEEVHLLDNPQTRVTALEFLIGRATILVGDSSGSVNAWFRTKPQPSKTSDGATLVKAHHLDGGSAAVTILAPSSRSRVVAVGYSDGALRLFQATSTKLLKLIQTPTAGPIAALTMTPKDDGLVSFSSSEIASWNVKLKHPEATLATLFRPVWYEEYPGPENVWQTSSGSQATEPKYGLMPLVFGTLKATFYSMIFGAPLALMAAIYSSEFLHPRTKSRIKPTIELMASLPSVVLGFLAALVFAPFVERHLPATILTVVTVPLAFLVAAHLWQLFPQWLALRLSPLKFLCILLVALPSGIVAGRLFGPTIERWLLGGDMRAWLDGQVGGPVGGWLLLFLPISGIAALLIGREVNSWLRQRVRDWSRGASALLDLLKLAAGVSFTVGVALVLSYALSLLRLDPRGTFVDTYMQRNAWVVGMVMGFAIIPIIYTLADDALSAIPGHLRSASLGAGATPWQTAVRIVIPTAMSGLFSAVMVGLGRAVGETMIVLMAAGSTPTMDVNIFSGFLTLSASIATELPEAAVNSTHFRILFLAGLTLFGLTLLINTGAEFVRQRFRRRAYEL